MRLRHPHICPIYEFNEDEGTYYLAMEWVDGASLASLIHRFGDGGIPVSTVAKIVADMAGALHHAHSACGKDGTPLGIVHRDVTPENIMVSFDGVVRLLDFGIAKAANQLNKTKQGELKGKFAYMSPEQYQGGDLDGRSDIFSLGVCLYEALTGQSLYARTNEYETVAAIVLDTATPSILDARPELPKELDAVVGKALAKSRQERFQTADEMQIALERFLADGKHMVRDADVANLLKKPYAERIASGPKLDRSPVWVAGPSEEETAQNDMEKLALHADLEGVEARLSRASRRKRRRVLIAATLLVLGTIVAAALALARVF